jgi:hypothetical protein
MPMLETLLLLTVYAAVPAAILLFLVRHKIDGAMQSVDAFILFVSVCTVITAHDPSNVWLLGLGAIVSVAFAAYGYSKFREFCRRTKEDQTYLQQERDHVKIDAGRIKFTSNAPPDRCFLGHERAQAEPLARSSPGIIKLP